MKSQPGAIPARYHITNNTETAIIVIYQVSSNAKNPKVGESHECLTAPVLGTAMERADPQPARLSENTGIAHLFDIENPEGTDTDVLINIFPNPADRVMTVRCSRQCWVHLLSSTGVVLLQKYLAEENNRIDVSHLLSGYYHLYSDVSETYRTILIE